MLFDKATRASDTLWLYVDCLCTSTPASKVENLLFATLGLPQPTMHNITPPRSTQAVNLDLLDSRFPTCGRFRQAAGTLPGLVPFFSVPTLMSDAQHSDTTKVKQSQTQHTDRALTLRYEPCSVPDQF